MHTLSASSPLPITLQDDISQQAISDLGCVDECVSAFDESTALLPSGDQNVVESQVFKPTKMTPIPKLQLATLCLVRLLEPIGFTQLFPYINEMVIKLNILDDPSKVGFVSGLVVSKHHLRLLSMHPSFSSTGERFCCLPVGICLPLGQNFGYYWPTSRHPRRCYWHGPHDFPLRIFPQFNPHAHYQKFAWFLRR
jgi:hypothetical protein